MASLAAIVGSQHTCPAVDGTTPHVGGPALTGSSAVFIEGKPACRQGDTLQCSSPAPDTVLQGSTAVFIEGKPAARVNDPTAHGGLIIQGATAVFIG